LFDHHAVVGKTSVHRLGCVCCFDSGVGSQGAQEMKQFIDSQYGQITFFAVMIVAIYLFT
jgi:hypothetical protein